MRFRVVMPFVLRGQVERERGPDEGSAGTHLGAKALLKRGRPLVERGEESGELVVVQSALQHMTFRAANRQVTADILPASANGRPLVDRDGVDIERTAAIITPAALETGLGQIPKVLQAIRHRLAGGTRATAVRLENVACPL
jgi:hypothetical protein